MFRAKIIGSLLAALVIIVLVAISQARFHLPQAISFGIMMFLTMLVTYPAWYSERHEITFKRWALVTAVASIIAATVSFIIKRVIG